jgi:membrane protein DedA with SNARE-associated domain
MLARSLTDTLAGISPLNGPMFMVAQVAGALAAMVTMGWLLAPEQNFEKRRNNY